MIARRRAFALNAGRFYQKQTNRRVISVKKPNPICRIARLKCNLRFHGKTALPYAEKRLQRRNVQKAYA